MLLGASSELEIRPARREDLGAIVQLLEQGGVTERLIDAFEAIASHPDNELVVVTLAGEVVGTLQLTFIPGLGFQGGWRAQVEGVRIRSDLRGLRIGTRLMEWVVDRARDRGCLLVQLTSNQARVDARRFYERLGFQTSHFGLKLYLS